MTFSFIANMMMMIMVVVVVVVVVVVIFIINELIDGDGWDEFGHAGAPSITITGVATTHHTSRAVGANVLVAVSQMDGHQPPRFDLLL